MSGQIASINMKYIILEKMATINFIYPEFPTAWRLSFKESRMLPAKCNENLQKWKRIMGSACKYPYIVVLWLYSVDMSTALLIYIPFPSSLLYLYRISFQLKKEEEENAR